MQRAQFVYGHGHVPPERLPTSFALFGKCFAPVHLFFFSATLKQPSPFRMRVSPQQLHYPGLVQSIKPFLSRTNAEKVLAAVVEKICLAIEDSYGRLLPSVYDNSEFVKNRNKYIRKIKLGRHLAEDTGALVDFSIDLNEIHSGFRSTYMMNSSRKVHTHLTIIFFHTEEGSKGASSSSAEIDDITVRKLREARLMASKENVVDLVASGDDDDDDDVGNANERNRHRNPSRDRAGSSSRNKRYIFFFSFDLMNNFFKIF